MWIRILTLALVGFSLNASATDLPEGCLPGLKKALGSDAKELTKENIKVGDSVWGKYKCLNCSSIASAKPHAQNGVSCPNCGTPHTTEPYFLGKSFAESDVVHSAEENALVKSGKKWICSFCHDSSFATDAACIGCGAPRMAESSHSGPHPVVDTRASATSASDGKGTALAIIGGTVGLGVAGGGIYWSQLKHPVEARVSKMSWVHSAQRQTFVRVTKRDWREDITPSQAVMPVSGGGENPGAFEIRNCNDEFYETETYACGTEEYTEQVSYEVRGPDETYMESNGNGSFTQQSRATYQTKYRDETRTRTKYCTRPIYKLKCDYDTYIWEVVEQKKESGSFPVSNTTPLPWPTFEFGPLDRQMRSEKYSVDFSYLDQKKAQTYATQPQTEAEFLSWKQGDEATLQKNNLGQVTSFVRGHNPTGSAKPQSNRH